MQRSLMIRSPIRRFGIYALVAAMAILLTGCLLSPGKFTSQLELKKNGTFSYSYDGQIHLLALSKLAEMGSKASSSAEAFSPEPCHTKAGSEERACTEVELAQQKGDWDSQASRKAASKKDEAEMMRGMLGGIDPSDPKAAEELADRLRRQEGWKSVDYKGDGLFEVSFAISGRLDHDFLFPTIEGFPMSNFFVQVTERKDHTFRVDAPGFSGQASAGPIAGMMAGLATASGKEAASQTATIPMLDGTFTILTDGQILANNTDEGPSQSTAGTLLRWAVTPATQAAPMALIKLGG